MGKLGTFILVSLLVSASLGIGYGIWRPSTPYRAAAHSEEQLTANLLAHLPDYVQKAEANVQAAYRFAMDHPDLLAQIPCYCGCEKTLHHKHNLDCYIAAFKPDGSVAQYTGHAAYCGVCVDTTLLARDLAGEGQTAHAIHTAIDAQYGYTEPHTHPAELVQQKVE